MTAADILRRPHIARAVEHIGRGTADEAIADLAHDIAADRRDAFGDPFRPRTYRDLIANPSARSPKGAPEPEED